QLVAWAEVKAVNGWSAHRIAVDGGPSAASAPDPVSPRIGAQILVRRPQPMPWGFAYAPRGPVAGAWDPLTIEALTDAVRSGLPAAAGRISHVRIDPEIEADGTHD